MVKKLLFTALLLTALSAPCYTESEIELCARVVAAEARGESYESQLAVATVIANRVEDGRWGEGLREVVLAENQFAEPFYDEYPQSCYLAAQEVLGSGFRLFDRAIQSFQRRDAEHWDGKPKFARIDSMTFYANSE